MSAALHLNRKKKDPFIRQVTASECVAGILVSANEQNDSKVLPSEEFLDLLGKLIKEANTPEFPVEGKLLQTLEEIQASTAGINLGDNGLKEWQGSGFKVRLVAEYDPSKFARENAIIFYPVGRKVESQLAEPSPDLAAAAHSLDTATESIARAKDVIVAAETASGGQIPSTPVHLPREEPEPPLSGPDA